jgi:3-dehydroquinate dehydratase type I
MTTRLVATVLVTDVDSPARYLRQPAEGVDYVELRFDALSEPSPSAVSAVLGLPRTVPVIATCRPVSQGGFFDGEESERMALLATAAEAGADIIDVEDGCLADLPEGLPGDRIASCHLSRFVPRLEALARRLLAHGTTFAKLAVPASTPKHLLDLLDLQAAFADRLSIVPTGRLAEAGRVMAASRGAPFVYGASDPEARGHPDQPTVERLHDVHNVTSLPPDMRFFAVIGSATRSTGRTRCSPARATPWRPTPSCARRLAGRRATPTGRPPAICSRGCSMAGSSSSARARPRTVGWTRCSRAAGRAAARRA